MNSRDAKPVEACVRAHSIMMQTPDKPSLRILLIEGEPWLQQTLTKVLERNGYEVSVATDVEQAMHLLPQKKFDLLLASTYPNGDRVLHLLRQLRQQYPIKAIAMSSYLPEQAKTRALQSGFDQFLKVPFALRSLLDAIEQISKNTG